MKSIRLGKTGVQVPAVGLGTWAYGGPGTVDGDPVGWSGRDDDAASRALLRAFDRGMTHWDTADVYGDGLSERIIGSMWGDVPRDAIFLASKVGWDPGTYGHFYHPDLMRARVERSLTNLQVEQIDLYYLHHCQFGPDDEYVDDAVEQLVRFRDEGKIRFLGLSDWDCDLVRKFADRVDPDVVQVFRTVAEDAFVTSGLQPWVHDRDVGSVFFSPLRHGLLLGKYSSPVTFPAGDFRSGVDGFQDGETIARLQEKRRLVEERFSDRPEPMLYGLLAPLIHDTRGGCVIVGQRSPEQVEHCHRVADVDISETDVEWVRSLYQS